MPGERLHEIGAEAVGHVLHFVFGDAAVGVAEDELAGKGFVDPQLDGGAGAVTLRPSGGHEQVRPRELEAFEVHVRRLIARQRGAAEHRLGIGELHEGQEAEVFVDGGVQLLAEPLCGLAGAEGGRHGQFDDVLARSVNVDLHGRLSGQGGEERREAEQEQRLGEQSEWFHDAFQGG